VVAAWLEPLDNKSGTADRLTGASSDVADKLQIHEMKVENGVMREVPDGLPISAGGSVEADHRQDQSERRHVIARHRRGADGAQRQHGTRRSVDACAGRCCSATHGEGPTMIGQRVKISFVRNCLRAKLALKHGRA
jgi:hypothetical protein